MKKIVLLVLIIMSWESYSANFDFIFGLGIGSLDSSISNSYSTTSYSENTTTTNYEITNLESSKLGEGASLRLGTMLNIVSVPLDPVGGDWSIGLGLEYNFLTPKKEEFRLTNIPLYFHNEFMFMKESSVRPLFYGDIGINRWSLEEQYRSFDKDGIGFTIGWGAGLQCDKNLKVVLNYRWNFMGTKSADAVYSDKYKSYKGTKEETITNQNLCINAICKF